VCSTSSIWPHRLLRRNYVHPRASRRIALATCDVAYAFRRAKRRTIGMVIGPDGLEVSAPRWVTVGEIEATLHEKADWIVRKLVEMQEHPAPLGRSTHPMARWRGSALPRRVLASRARFFGGAKEK